MDMSANEHVCQRTCLPMDMSANEHVCQWTCLPGLSVRIEVGHISAQITGTLLFNAGTKPKNVLGGFGSLVGFSIDFFAYFLFTFRHLEQEWIHLGKEGGLEPGKPPPKYAHGIIVSSMQIS